MPEEITPLLALAASAQIGLLLTGCVVLWRLQLSPTARRAGPVLRLTPWTLNGFDFAVLALAVMVGGLFGQIVTHLAARSLGLAANGDLMMVVAGGGFQAGLLLGVVAGLGVIRARLPVPPLPGGRTEPSVLLAGGATFAAALPLLTAVNLPWTYLLEQFGLSADRQELVELFARADSPAIIVVVTVMAVVVAPVVEELIFRAGLFRFMRTRTPRALALGLPAVLFASLHGNLAAFLPLVGLGLIFALAYERTGRIAVPIIAHALFNLNTILLLLAGVNV